MSGRTKKWRSIVCNAKDLQLTGTLDGGQSFRWKYSAEADTWTGVFSKTVWKLKKDRDSLLYQVVGSILSKEESPSNAKSPKRSKKNAENGKCEKFEQLLRSYLRLDINLGDLYKEWSRKDALFAKACQKFHGVRMLDQEPVENLFSFICSQNNHISRISGMVEKLCHLYGEKICEIDDHIYHAFPSVEKLADPKVQDVLRKEGFGYRCKFIQKSASQLLERGGEPWLWNLREVEYTTARSELIKLHGIGPKVADCICLMSLGKLEAVPVDTHVHSIASKHYLPHLARRTLTDAVHKEIQQYFIKLYGERAGWAQTVLFCSDLKKFQEAPQAESTKKKNKPKINGNCTR